MDEAVMESKPTNPKDVAAISKLSMAFVPPILQVYAAIGFTEGALKYGAYNWRPGGASASVYYSALLRHMAKWWNGEEFDINTGVPHLASAISCLGIICDAREQGCLVDDRPPVQVDFSKNLDGMENLIRSLQELFKDKHPHHHTIMDAKQEERDTVHPFENTGLIFKPFSRPIFINGGSRPFSTFWPNTKQVHLQFNHPQKDSLILIMQVDDWSNYIKFGKFNNDHTEVLERYYG